MTKERLRAYKDIRAERDQIQEQLKALEATMYHPRAVTYGERAGHSSQPAAPVASAAERHEQLQQVYRQKLDRLAAELLEIEAAMDSLPHRERVLLRYHYIDGLTWEQVCVRMSYGWSQIHRIHAKALRMLSEEGET